MLLQDKTFLVTGAGRGLGQGIALAIAEAGGRVVVTDLEPPTATAERVADAGGDALALAADVTDRGAVARAITAAAERCGRLDGLVANAGVIRMAPALDDAATDHELQFAVNVDGLLSCCRLVAERLIAQGGGGAIVNVASNAGKVGYPNMASYNASKAAVINFTQTSACDLGKYHVRVNAVCPGLIETGMTKPIFDYAREAGKEEKLGYRCELRRYGRPEEVAAAILFLASDEASYITGQALPVDGGNTASLNLPGMKV